MNEASGMNIYDTDQTVELYENRGINQARKREQKKKRYDALIKCFGLVIVAHAIVTKRISPAANLNIAGYIFLYVLWAAALNCFQWFGNWRIVRKIEAENYSAQEKHDYNLVVYRNMKNAKNVLKAGALIHLAVQDLNLGQTDRAKQALSLVVTENLDKKKLKTYYLVLAATSFLAGEENWKMQLEQCLAIPVQTMSLSDEELRNLFAAGDRNQLIEVLKSWENSSVATPKGAPFLIVYSGIVTLLTAVFYGVQMLPIGQTDLYFGISLIGIAVLFFGWIVLIARWCIELIVTSGNTENWQGRGKRSRVGVILYVLLLWGLLTYLCVMLASGAWKNVYERRSAVKAGWSVSQEDDSLTQDAGDNAEVSSDASSVNNDTSSADNNAGAENSNAETESDKEAADNNAETGDDIDSENNTEESGKTHDTSSWGHGPISAEEFASFKVKADASAIADFNVFDDFSETMEKNFVGTWYCADPDWNWAIRIEEDGTCYMYDPDEGGQPYGNKEPYHWKLIDRSDKGLCPELGVYLGEPEGAADGFAFYIAGCTDDYFWCNAQQMIMYRQ